MEEYAVNIARSTLQKYASAVAFAIIKLKPENVTTLDFINELKDQYKNKPFTSKIDHQKPTNLEAVQDLRKDFETFTTQPINSESLAVFKTISQSSQLVTYNNDSASCSVSELEVLLIAENIKRIICSISKRNCFDQRDAVIHNNLSQTEMSQDSGYRSSQSSESFRNKNTDLVSVNNYLSKVAIYLNTVTRKTLDIEVVHHLSTMFGIALDELYALNIYLPFYDNVTDILDSSLKALHDNSNHEASFIHDVLFKFHVFTRSQLIAQYCLQKLTQELKMLMEPLLLKNSVKAIELTEPSKLDYTFYVLQIFEIILKQKNQLKPIQESQLNPGGVNVQSSQKLSDEDLSKEYTSLFSTIVLECAQSYPLLAFWAMECHNIHKHYIKNK